MNELVLISVVGTDQPGITAVITQLLDQQDVDILDIGQSVIHDHLSLGILANISGDAISLKTAIDRIVSDFMVEVSFALLTEQSYDR